jgi:hypothetical protein
LAGFGFPLFAPTMYSHLGYGKGDTILAIAAIIIGWPACVRTVTCYEPSKLNFEGQTVAVLVLWRADTEFKPTLRRPQKQQRLPLIAKCSVCWRSSLKAALGGTVPRIIT